MTAIDLLTLDLHATLAARLDAPVVATEADEGTEDEAEPAGALQIAISLDDTPEPAADAAAA